MNDFRRHDDDPLYERLQRLENTVAALETKVNTLSLEQKHMLDLFGARFSTVERSQDLALSELRALTSQITTMASEADKSPAGRMLLKALGEMQKDARDGQDGIDGLKEWQQRVDGVLKILQWMGLSGVAALIWVALRAFGKVP